MTTTYTCSSSFLLLFNLNVTDLRLTFWNQVFDSVINRHIANINRLCNKSFDNLSLKFYFDFFHKHLLFTVVFFLGEEALYHNNFPPHIHGSITIPKHIFTTLLTTGIEYDMWLEGGTATPVGAAIVTPGRVVTEK